MTKSELIEIIARKQRHLPAKDVELAVKHLLELEVRLRRQRYELRIKLKFRTGTLEVKSCTDLSIRLVDTIAGLVSIEVTNYVKRGHWGVSLGLINTS